MSDDKAREYARARVEIYNAGGCLGLEEWAGREAELAAAYRAGYAEGHAAANRIVVINEGPLNAPRGLS